MPEAKSDRSTGRRDAAGVSIGALRAFIAVVDQGGFSRAAAELGVSQPNISSQIGALEAACGVRLLNRRSHNQSLTDAGRELYLRARLVVSRMTDFEEAAGLYTGLKKGRVVVGFSTPPVALQLIGRYMQTYPDLEIVTRLGNTSSLLADIQDCRADIAVLSLLEPETGVYCRKIATQGLNLLAPADQPLGRRAEATLKDLVKARLVSREPGSVTRALTERAFEQAGVPYNPILTVESREAVKEAVANGVGFGTVLDGEIGEDARIRALPVRDLDISCGVYLVCLRETLEIPAVQVFADLASTLKVS
jgi:DNA-binding transcriptional LysR family regulator